MTSGQYILSGKHCVKSLHIRNYSGPHFPAFELNAGRYGVSLRIQSECRNMRARIARNMDNFHAVLTKVQSLNSGISFARCLLACL